MTARRTRTAARDTFLRAARRHDDVTVAVHATETHPVVTGPVDVLTDLLAGHWPALHAAGWTRRDENRYRVTVTAATGDRIDLHGTATPHVAAVTLARAMLTRNTPEPFPADQTIATATAYLTGPFGTPLTPAAAPAEEYLATLLIDQVTGRYLPHLPGPCDVAAVITLFGVLTAGSCGPLTAGARAQDHLDAADRSPRHTPTHAGQPPDRHGS